MTVPDLVDVAHPEADAFVWYALEYEGEDLEPFECARQSFGRMYEGTTYELHEGGMLDMMIGIGWKHEDSGEGWSFTSSWLYFALTHGIAPGQPFLVRHGKPDHYTTHTQEGTEHDVDFDSEVVRVLPWSAARVLRRWAKFLHIMKQDRESYRQSMRDLRRLRATDVDAMFLQHSIYPTSRQSSWEIPGGKCIALCSNHTRCQALSKFAWHELLQVRNEAGNRDEAMAALLLKVRTELPHLDVDTIKALPVRYR